MADGCPAGRSDGLRRRVLDDLAAGATGAIERTQGPFESWLRESTLLLPVFVLAVLGALTLAMRWFGPVLGSAKAVIATALTVVGAGTVVGVGALAVSSAYDYYLQLSQLELVASMGHLCGSGGCLAQQQQASLGLQVQTVGYGGAILRGDVADPSAVSTLH